MCSQGTGPIHEGAHGFPWPRRQPDMEQWHRDLAYATKVQSLLLEERPVTVPGVRAVGCSIPHYEVGGDYFDFLNLSDGGLRILVADVMGKGLGPAMVVMMMYAAVRAVSDQCPSPGRLLQRVNDLLYTDLQRVGAFVTAACIDYCPQSRQLTMASAGHPSPFILRQPAASIEQVPVRGVSLGMAPNRAYREERALVTDGDRLVVYSDGLAEARDPAGRELTAAGLECLVRTHADLSGKDLMHKIVAEVAEFTGGTGLRDDATLVITEFG